jgi:hypothetical protein
MTARTWLGGRGNNANDARDWSPGGAPQPGDTLTMNRGTINIGADNPLGSDWLTVTGNATLNLRGTTGDHLNFTGRYGPGNTPIKDTVNLINSDAWITGHQANVTVRTSGNSHLFLYPDVPRGSGLTATIKNSGVLDASFSGYMSYRIDGGTFQNEGSGGGFDGTTAVINADVVGTGSWLETPDHASYGKLEFMQSVSAGQTVQMINGAAGGYSLLQIDQPGRFAGEIKFNTYMGVIDLPKLAADSYSYDAAAGALDFWHGNTLLAALRFSTAENYTVAKGTSTGGAGVEIFSTDTGWRIPHGALLDTHYVPTA